MLRYFHLVDGVVDVDAVVLVGEVPLQLVAAVLVHTQLVVHLLQGLLHPRLTLNYHHYHHYYHYYHHYHHYIIIMPTWHSLILSTSRCSDPSTPSLTRSISFLPSLV